MSLTGRPYSIVHFLLVGLEPFLAFPHLAAILAVLENGLVSRIAVIYGVE